MQIFARAYISLIRPFLSAAPHKNQEASAQSAQSPQREGGAGECGQECGAASVHVLKMISDLSVNGITL